MHLNLNFAIAGVLLTKLKFARSLQNIRFTATDVMQLQYALEKATRLAVINGFTREACIQHLDMSKLFQSAHDTDTREPCYKLNMIYFNISDGPEQAILDAVDPPLNYPMKILTAARIPI